MSRPNNAPLDEAGRYLYVRELGSGAFGAVVAARPVPGKDGELVAIKRLARSHLNKLVESELLNHSQLRHPHVVQLREVYLSPRYVNIVMEYASGGSLYKYLRDHKRLDEPLAR
jgi:serine/threonine-protein kinase SRK2